MPSLTYNEWQKKVHDWLDGDANDGGCDWCIHHFLLGLIILNVLSIVVKSLPAIHDHPVYSPPINALEVWTLRIFLIEYIFRVWSSKAVGRRRDYVFSTMGIIDFLTLLPLFIHLQGPNKGLSNVLRAVRVGRIIKLFRYIPGIELIHTVVASRKKELIGSVSIMLLVMLCGGTVIYYLESPHQPDKFTSIPTSMWWAAATMTTIGYGDVYPITAMGKVFGAIYGILGIFTFALPTAIIGSGFIDEINARKSAK
jgi:voltage-gated potassium channel